MIALSLRVLAVAILAIVTGLAFRRARPSARSLIWNSALIAVVVLPVAWALAPSLTLTVPRRLLSIVSPVAGSAGRSLAVDPMKTVTTHPARTASVGYAGASDSYGELLWLVWLVGLAYFVARFARQVTFARRLVRGATPASHVDLSSVYVDAKLALDIHADVPVLESSQLDIPLVTGVLSPTIVLPSYSSEWSRDELRIVLLHELAHVRRADVVARAAAMAACGLHWFNPLVWILNGFSARDAELAADDLVLQTGVRPSTYADALLNIAGSAFHYPYAQPAVPLARRGLLTERVEAILRESRPHTDVGRFTKSAIIGWASITALLGACITFAPARAGSPTPASNEPRQASAPIEAATVSAPIADPGALNGVSGRQSALPAARHVALGQTTDTSWVAGATDELIRALADSSPQVRGAAAHSLGNLRAVRARPVLQQLREDSDKSVRYDVERALTMLSN